MALSPNEPVRRTIGFDGVYIYHSEIKKNGLVHRMNEFLWKHWFQVAAAHEVESQFTQHLAECAIDPTPIAPERSQSTLAR